MGLEFARPIHDDLAYQNSDVRATPSPLMPGRVVDASGRKMGVTGNSPSGHSLGSLIFPEILPFCEKHSIQMHGRM
jgi:hypothetical protein